eukprot:scaffold1806_cov363-Pavlova_lutheri.AAC.1
MSITIKGSANIPFMYSAANIRNSTTTWRKKLEGIMPHKWNKQTLHHMDRNCASSTTCITACICNAKQRNAKSMAKNVISNCIAILGPEQYVPTSSNRIETLYFDIPIMQSTPPCTPLRDFARPALV